MSGDNDDFISEQYAEDMNAKETPYTARFGMESHDYGISVFVKCHSLDHSPNQGDLRAAISALIKAVENWDNFDIRIKSEELP